MRIAVHGLVLEGAGSAAGIYPMIFEELLARGHELDFYGIPGFTETPRLGSKRGYRYLPLTVPALEPWWKAVMALKISYVEVGFSQLSHLAYQLEAMRRVARESERRRYDAVFCVNTIQLCPSKLPVLSWPQGPPHTEASVLRSPDVARQVIATSGRAYHWALRLFYAFRSLQSHAVWRFSTRLLCATHWVYDEWVRFGVAPERLAQVPYPVAHERFEAVPPPGRSPDRVTFLWLGRVVPRKRFDLFWEAFELLAERHSDVHALIAGNLEPGLVQSLRNSRFAARVDVRGPVAHDAIPALFAEADVLVAPSENEPYGFAPVEALAAGRPVVLGPTNGVEEYAGDAGFRFTRYSALEVADAMGRARAAVASDAGAIAATARRQVRSQLTVAHTADALRDELQRILPGGAGSR